MSNAETFHALHRTGLLLLANAWDAGSARLIESLGARAIATTSAAVAWANGYADGDLLPVDELVATVIRIARVVAVPLTVDVEGGYADAPAAVAETVARVIGAGAVGINIEDGTRPADLLCAKIEAARDAAARAGVALFINARTDVYLRGLVDEPARVDEVLTRAARYHAAGADGLFVPLLAESAAINAIAVGAGMPLNIMAIPELSSAAELEALGVRRLSAGPGVATRALSAARQAAEAFLRDGTLPGAALGSGEINGLFANS